MGCSPATGATDGTPTAQLLLRPALPASLAEATFSLPVDRARVLLTRSTGVTIIDTLILFPPDSVQVSARVKLPLATARELVSVSVELRSNRQLLFAGRREVEMRAGELVSPPLALSYVGPGADLIALRLSPRDSVLAPGDTITFGLEAFSAAGPTRSYYVGWASSNPALATVNAVGLLRAPNRRGATTVRVVSPSGIRDSTRIWFAPPATRLEFASGNLQSDTVGRTLRQPLGVRILAADNEGVPGMRVRFRAAGLGRTLDSLVITDSTGVARTTGTLGLVAGPELFLAEVAGLGTLAFSTVARPDIPQRILITAGDGQRAPPGTVLPGALTVLVTDNFNNPVPGAQLTWTILDGEGTLVESSAETAADGRGAASLRLGPQAGANRVRVAIAAGPTVEFTALAEAGPGGSR